MTRWRRWGKATQAAFLGWTAAFAMILAALGFGFAVWLLLTFACVCVVWLCVVSPIAFLGSEQWLLRHRCWVIAIAVVTGFLVTNYIAHAWTYMEHSGIGVMNYWAAACFAIVFSGVTAYWYLRKLNPSSQSS